MNILLINGSPKGERSNSLRLANAFVNGVKAEAEGEILLEKLDISKMNISPCKGCFACWKATPGECCIKDDMSCVIEKLLWADMIIYSFPLYYFNIPGGLKNLIDRQLPMVLPFMSDRNDGIGSGSHEARYDMSRKKFVLVSTCGFYSAAGNYDSVCGMFDHICGRDNYEKIFCGQGELFGYKELSARTDEYLGIVEKAGREYAGGAVSAETAKALQTLLFPKDVFEKMADASWGVSKESGEKEDESLVFTRQMAALYNKDSYDGKERVLEICYTDLGKTYQILLNEKGSEVQEGTPDKYTTRIDTPWDVWLSIAQNEIRGDEALAKQMYRVTGDFSLMINWDKFFGSAGGEKQPSEAVKGSKKEKPPVMASMLAMWITFWVAVSINSHIGALITLAVCALIPLITAKRKSCIYDKLSMSAVSLLSIFALAFSNGTLAANIGYLIFGLMWLCSCFTKEPLCAAYVKYNYGGDDALNNPIFMKSNYILAAAWGVLYIATAAWTFFLAKTPLAPFLPIINNIMPVIMGIFTVWFEKWYPSHVAKGGK